MNERKEAIKCVIKYAVFFVVFIISTISIAEEGFFTALFSGFLIGAFVYGLISCIQLRVFSISVSFGEIMGKIIAELFLGFVWVFKDIPKLVRSIKYLTNK